ncbi:MAG: YkuS family protein [Clostridia bacterium]|nr:YkuS family protein [Clostridia bacterium]
MVIAVENGLENIKDYLKSRGYKILTPDSSSLYDAVIYENLHFSGISAPKKAVMQAGDATGVFLICAHGKTPQEIEAILCQKAYFNLF